MKMLRDVLVKDVIHSFCALSRLRIACALLLLSLHCSAQNLNNDYSKQEVDAAVLRQQHNYEMEMYQRYTGDRYKPYMGVSVGFPRFFGDVMPSKTAVTDLGLLYGFNVSVTLDEGEHFLLNAYTLFGNMHSYRQDFSSAVDNLNFLTHVGQFDLSLTYQYKLLFDIVHPYVRAGVGVLQFNPMGDLRDAEERYYQYPYPSFYPQTKSSDKHIAYDKRYETDLRRRNLYGDGSYSRVTPVIPLELGLGFKVGSFFFVRLGYMLTYTFTDFLDNVSGKTAKKAQETYAYGQARSELNADYLSYYGDVAPQKRAAALDAGTANDMYGAFHISLQVRPFTSTRKVHNMVYAGSEMSNEEVANYQKVVLSNEGYDDAPKSRFTPDKIESKSVLKKKRIPRRFRSLDSNGDGVISGLEMNSAIEQFLEGDSKLKRRDITKLHKFYNSQVK